MSRKIRRCELICPGHSPKMIAKALAAGADEVIFDLEDACAQSQKDLARHTVIEAFQSHPLPPEVVVGYRINGVDTAHGYRDVIDVLQAVGARVQVLVVPKVRSVDDVRFVDRLVSQIEMRCRLPAQSIRLEVLIETASGLLQAPAIATCTPRLDSLIFGIADFAAELGMKDFRESPLNFLFARQQMLLAARAAGIDAIDAVTVQYKDLDRVTEDAKASAALGYDGKWAIHLSQVAPIQAAFTPTAEEIARAQTLVARYQQADSQGQGAMSVDDEMVDAATLAVEQRRLSVARRAGLVPSV
jgi:citrate lyase subunit beta / citryl-CoA lyase